MATQKPNPILDYVAQAAKSQSDSKQAQIEVESAMAEQTSAEQEQITQYRAAGKAKAAVIAGTESIASATDAEKARIVGKFGTSYEDQASQSNRWADEMRINADKAYAAMDSVNALKGKDFLSDPLGFISAQFSLPGAAAEYNNYVDKHEAAKANLTSITQASDSAVIAAARAAKTTSTELAIARGEEALALNEAGVQDLIAKNAGTRIQGIRILNEMSAQQLSQAFQFHSAQNSDKSLAMQAESNRMQREARALAIAESKDRLEAKEAQLEAIKYEMDSYNAGARRTGKMTFDSLERFRTAYKSSQNLPEFINTMSSGKLIMLNKGITDGVMVADNAGEAALIYSTGQATTPVARFLKKQVYDVKQNVAAPKDRVGFVGSVNGVAIERATKMSKQIDQESPEENIYSAPPASIILSAKSTDSPFINSVVRPMLEANPNAKIPDAVMLSKAIDPSVNINDAASSLANYYKVAVTYNNTANQYVENGLPKQTNYKANIDGAVIDLTDEVAIKRYILKKRTPAIGIFSAQRSVE